MVSFGGVATIGFPTLGAGLSQSLFTAFRSFICVSKSSRRSASVFWRRIGSYPLQQISKTNPGSARSI
jgi:site-specific recombinase